MAASYHSAVNYFKSMGIDVERMSTVPPTGQTFTTNYRTDLKWLSIKQHQIKPVLGDDSQIGTEQDPTFRENLDLILAGAAPIPSQVHSVHIMKRDGSEANLSQGSLPMTAEKAERER